MNFFMDLHELERFLVDSLDEFDPFRYH
jgi:hypothetical protein